MTNTSSLKRYGSLLDLIGECLTLFGPRWTESPAALRVFKALRCVLCLLSISFVGCLDELDEPSPEPPTEELSLDGGLYVPSAPETSSPYGEGAGSGSGSGAMSAPDHQRIEEKGASPSEAEEDLLLDDVCVQDAVIFEEVEYE